MTLLIPSHPAIQRWGFEHCDDVLSREFISQKYAEDAQKQILDSLSQSSISIFYRIFPNYNDAKRKEEGVVLCLRQYHLFSSDSNSDKPSIKEKKIIPKEGILAHNMRFVASEKIEGKLAQKLKDAQRHLALGENPKWKFNRAKIAVPHLQNATPQNLDRYFSDNNSLQQVFDVSVASTQGRREGMEDIWLVTMVTIQGKQYPLFAVFDGHGGRGCAEYMGKHLAGYIEKQAAIILSDSSKKLHDEVYNLLRTAFVALGREYRKECSKNQTNKMQMLFGSSIPPITQTAATTATALLFFDGYLYTANVGDSRAILSEISEDTAGGTLALSEDASLLISKYADSVEKRGGKIVFLQGCPRVNGGPNMARAVGYEELEGFNPIADVTRIPLSGLKDGKEYRITIATDGLWKEASSEQITGTINSAKNQSPEYLADYFTREAYAVGSDDNITAIVIALTSKGIATLPSKPPEDLSEDDFVKIQKSPSFDNLPLAYTRIVDVSKA